MNADGKDGQNAPVSQRGKESWPHLDLARAVLEFISRCFYPAIIVFVILLFLPTLKQIDLAALITRVQSAKVGDYEVTFQQAQDIGAQTAQLNSKVAELERAMVRLRSDLDSLGQQSKISPVNETVRKERAKLDKQFQDNSRFTVLVFHSRTTHGAGEKLADTLLKAGFKASATETGFSELHKIQPIPGTIHITYNTAGQSVLSDVKQLMDDAKIKGEVKVNARAIDLSRGDVQILLF